MLELDIQDFAAFGTNQEALEAPALATDYALPVLSP